MLLRMHCHSPLVTSILIKVLKPLTLTGLYQFSYAGHDGGYLYSAGYAVGASADYSTGDFDLGLWVGDTDTSELSVEYYVGYGGIENLSLNVAIADDPGYDTTNIWATYDLW